MAASRGLATHTIKVDQDAATNTIVAAPGAGLRIVVIGIHGHAGGTFILKSGAGGTEIFETLPAAGRPHSFADETNLCNCDTNALLELTTGSATNKVQIVYRIIDDATYLAVDDS